LEARTTAIGELLVGTQMFVPSKAGIRGSAGTVTVMRIAPVESSLKSLSAPTSVTQTFAPSKTAP
jgi:hypothetical protein